VPPTEADTAEPPAAGTQRVRRRKKRKKAAPAKSVLVLFGLRFSWAMLAVATVLLLAAVVGYAAWAWLGSGLRPDVEVVDAFLALDHVPQIGDFTPGAAALAGLPREPTRLLVTRPNAAGRHLLVSFSLPQKVLDEHFGSKVMISALSSSEVHLNADGETVRPLFLTDALPAKGFVVNYLHLPGGQGGLMALAMPVFFGPPDDSPWQHEGEVVRLEDTHTRFQGKGGMEVNLVREDQPQRRAKVTWDAKSRGWLGTGRTGNPNNLLGGWDVTCAFPRPTATRQLEIVILGRSIPLDLRFAAPGG
jgi:hypothetical protein